MTMLLMVPCNPGIYLQSLGRERGCHTNMASFAFYFSLPIRVDTTRVEFTISLRENWSLPFLALQIAAITCYLRPQLSALQQVHTDSHCRQFYLFILGKAIY